MGKMAPTLLESVRSCALEEPMFIKSTLESTEVSGLDVWRMESPLSVPLVDLQSLQEIASDAPPGVWHAPSGNPAKIEHGEEKYESSTALPDDSSRADQKIANVSDIAWAGYPESAWKDFQCMPEVPQATFPTVGSYGHQYGVCKPCAFAWREEGCKSGAECAFCHLCPSNEKQRRKRQLRRVLRDAGYIN